MFEEKRRSKRVKENFSILCRVFQRIELDVSVSRLVDISQGGMCFLFDNPVSPGDLLQISFRIPPTSKEKAELFGRVVACNDDKGRFKIRIAFIDIPAATKANLDRLIDQTSLKENKNGPLG